MPIPRRKRPRISIKTFTAAPLMIAPTKKVRPPPNMDHLRPNALVTVEAKKEAIRAARYKDDVNSVRSSLLNLQYSLVETSSCSLWYTDGKNRTRKESIDVTPPEIPRSYPKMRPPLAATRHARNTKTVNLAGYSFTSSLAIIDMDRRDFNFV
ncbi:hypothetical protein IEQ34_019766 [Dendrobium chrysotoxum]|uniref:Uncharacterized protein n=1 Tax=Dendrobium chrysotoxum TaxID=161865 RepID=A0AAV7G9N1_DENCH|nr:hypothetical protein IEQ34_019766 [Dendrobium chrysotoxum]